LQRRRRISLDMEGLAAPAAPLLVRIAEDEARLELLLDVIHLSTQDEKRGLRIDQHPYPVLLDDLVRRLVLIGLFQRVAEARAALAAHADADADRGLAAAIQQLLHPLGRGFGQLDRLWTRSRHDPARSPRPYSAASTRLFFSR